MLKHILSGIVFMTIAVAGYSQTLQDCGKKKPGLGMTNSEWVNCVVGKTIPDFKVKTISGEKLDSKSMKGKVLVINFWFIHCAPCVAEVPALNKLVSEYKDKDVVFLSFATDDKGSIQEDFLPKHPFEFGIVADAKHYQDIFGVAVFPTTFIIDTEGKIKSAWYGGPVNDQAATAAYKKAKPIIDGLLQAKGTTEKKADE